ncbi:MAG: hypothetical protein SCM11_02025 [Bacillota bacterium]|nr:hypothetical protein [Bacillota bacterium]
MLPQLYEDAPPAQIKSDLQIRGEVMAVVDSRYDVVPVKQHLQIAVRIIRIPLVRAGAQPFEEQEAFADKGIEGAAIERMFTEETVIIVNPSPVTVDRAIRVTGPERILILVLDGQAIVFFIGAACLGFFFWMCS